MSRLESPAYMRPLLPNWLRRLFIPEPNRTAQYAAGRYEAAFVAAQARSILWGLRPPAMEPLPVRYASPSAIAAVRWQLHRSIGHLSEDVVATQRFGITAAVRTMLEAELKVPLAFTLGYVRQNGQRLCYTPIEGLEQMLRTGIAQGARVSLHAWLTLPSHEVIDLSFWALFPDSSCAEEREMRSLFTHPDQMLGRSYCPQWIGDGFVRGIGVLKEYEGW
ncbi:hypothetical protein [Lysobacter gummosus]|uniref:Uncharacterized protein n=1 Tax=Lysobacter gummosus TaxID=262324 RepID=A0ABY3XE45_9GAMM|nr:hypothetical protein [Lysobacter gummosus]UNP29226.1 hypothetical protein MOV92_22615 [Lysobacter gummosus]